MWVRDKTTRLQIIVSSASTGQRGMVFLIVPQSRVHAGILTGGTQGFPSAGPIPLTLALNGSPLDLSHASIQFLGQLTSLQPSYEDASLSSRLQAGGSAEPQLQPSFSSTGHSQAFPQVGRCARNDDANFELEH